MVLILALVLASGLIVVAEPSLLTGWMRVQESVENFRDEPDGRKLGTLLEGAEVEKIAQEGKWVRFRIEGWVWGPSLEGFVEEKPPRRETSEPSVRLPLQDVLPRVKRLISEKFGTFYSLSIDEDLNILRVRLRVGDIGTERLERRQMAVQQQVWNLVGKQIDVVAVRVETNRADGSGTVGTIMAEIKVDVLEDIAAGEVDSWRQRTRFSQDGGETWEEGQ